MFLRGTGTRIVAAPLPLINKQYTGEDLGNYGYDRMPNHRHNINVTTSEAGEHRHPLRRDSWGNQDGYAMAGTDNSDESLYNNNDDSLMGANGNHSHNFSGDTSYSGTYINTWETRPVNYGVNYIIKI